MHAPSTLADAPRLLPARALLRYELVVVVGLYWVYDAINSFAPKRAALAIRHGESVLHLEHILHVDPERWTNAWLDAHHILAIVLADFYDVAHLAVTGVVIALTWWFAPAVYPRMRNALVGINVVGFAVFWLYPVAPPRLLPGAGFIDVVASTHAVWSWHSGDLAAHANDFAAMPSLHVGWAIWCLVAVWAASRSVTLRSLGVVHVVLTVIAVMATGNHYLADVVAGVATAVVAFAVANQITARRGRAPSDPRDDPRPAGALARS